MSETESIARDEDPPSRIGSGGVENPAPKVFEKLLRSVAWRVYQRAFLNTTGLPLRLESMDGIGESTENGNRFCRLVNRDFACSCTRCPLSRLGRENSPPGSSAVVIESCGAGLRHAAIPIRMGEHAVARLVTGQVATERPSMEFFADRVSPLWAKRPAAELDEAVEAYLMTLVISKEQFDQATALVAAFAVQIGGRINRILIEDAPGDPGWVKSAREILRPSIHPGKRISRDSLVSEARFRQFTGQSFDEFRQRCRLERACCRLLDPAFPRHRVPAESGYRSEGEMRDAFQTFLGDTPDEYRARMLVNDRLLAAWPDFAGHRQQPLAVVELPR